MWVKLIRHIGEGSLWYSLNDIELKLIEGDLISCKLKDGSIIKLPIAFRYVPWLRTINGIHYHMELKCPFIMGSASNIELDEIEVNSEEMDKYK